MATKTESSKSKEQQQRPWTENWENVRRDLKQKYETLTEEDLKYQKGREKELYERVGHRIGKNPSETENLINETSERGQRTKEKNPNERERTQPGKQGQQPKSDKRQDKSR